MFSDVEGENPLDSILPKRKHLSKQKQTTSDCVAAKSSVKDRLGQVGLYSKTLPPSGLVGMTPSSVGGNAPSNRSSVVAQEKTRPLSKLHPPDMDNGSSRPSLETPFEAHRTHWDMPSKHLGGLLSKSARKKPLCLRIGTPPLHPPSTVPPPPSPLVNHSLPPQSSNEINSLIGSPKLW